MIYHVGHCPCPQREPPGTAELEVQAASASSERTLLATAAINPHISLVSEWRWARLEASGDKP